MKIKCKIFKYKNASGEVYFVPKVRKFLIYWSFIYPHFDYTSDILLRIDAYITNFFNDQVYFFNRHSAILYLKKYKEQISNKTKNHSSFFALDKKDVNLDDDVNIDDCDQKSDNCRCIQGIAYGKLIPFSNAITELDVRFKYCPNCGDKNEF